MDAKNRTVGSAVEREIAWRGYRADPVRWIESSWKIKKPRSRPGIMKLWPEQHTLIDAYMSEQERYVSLKARQLGWTTTTTAWSAWTCLFEEYTPWLYVSQTQGDAIKNLGFVKFGWANLPEWQKERIGSPTSFTSELVEWTNGSRIESIPATGSAGRGDAVYGVMWDEAAFAPDPDEQMAAIDPLVYGKLILLSTANGMGNLFQRTYADSQMSDSEWKGMFFPWWVRPDRQNEDGSPNMEWYAREARSKRATPWLMHQEYPNNDVEAFVKSGRTPIGHELMEEYDWVEPALKMVWNGEEFVEEYDPNHALILDVWELPTIERDENGAVIRNPNYVVFADPAEGVEGGDATAVAVYDANHNRCVARIQTHYQLEGLPEVLESLAYFYSTALLGVERNNHGFGVLNILFNQLSYPRLYTMPKLTTRKTGHSDMLGWHTNMTTKPKMVRDYARAMVKHEVEPRDPVLRKELMTFVQDENGKYGASSGNHDDVVIAHFGALQLIEDVGRFPVIERPIDDGILRMVDFDEVAFGRARSERSRIGGRRSTKARSFEVPVVTPTARG